jgi:FtsZ-interacting cell division protein ZipA
MQTFLPLVLIVIGLISIAIVVIFELRKTPKQEAKMIKREDKAISKLPDDPREMARWVP